MLGTTRAFSPRPCVAAEGFDALLCCPTCGSDDVHPHRVAVNRGGKVLEVTRDGVGHAVDRTDAHGAITTLDFFCEDGHGFALRFQFHKGATLFRAEVTPVPQQTLWRD